MGEVAPGPEVVVCYSENDKPIRNALIPGLDQLRNQSVISLWRDECISADRPGSFGDTDGTSSLRIVLLLLSPDIVATGYCERKEIQSALVDAGETVGNISVITVLVRPVDAEGNDTLARLIRLAVDARPLSESPESAAQIAKTIHLVRQRCCHRSPGFSPDTVVLPNSHLDAGCQELDGDADTTTLDRIGRYKIKRVLGQGVFGRVYLALDEELDRSVAIKTPRRRSSPPIDMEAYEREARMVAQLDHPGIVPVYDVGRSEDGQFYVVSKFIEGMNLAELMKQSRPTVVETARLVARVAEALHYAHEHELVHRDVKPANILVRPDGRPYVADFGLAIHEDELGRGPNRAGTPAYMSPEQARGEGHRVDGRSDVFSLGVVLYELLTGRRPFVHANIEELFALIAKSEAKPPRQRDGSIPTELERICLKAMSNRIKDRYTTAKDLADDLWYFLDPQRADAEALALSAVGSGLPPGPCSPGSQFRAAWEPDPTRDSSQPSSRQLRESTSRGRSSTTEGRASSRGDSKTRAASVIVPKGLRAYDVHDAGFFLELLPGPRDRYGLPESIRFWKSRIENTDSDQTFSVGLVYGPSGCGKSSFVNAGLLPQVDPRVHSMMLEASAVGTESRLAERIKRRFPGAPADAGLADTLAWIRRGRGMPRGHKLLIVLDQFEQWLQAQDTASDELLNAFRQCDGGRIQGVLIVRVDFLMSIHRFMNDLEVSIREGFNSAAVDLFDPLHARKVLQSFGRSLGCLPEDGEAADQQQQTFLDSAVQELAANGKIVPVHLALFAEMCKGRLWRRETLEHFGGTRGIGVTFLEETFESDTAPLEHRIHQTAARSVLGSLLPPSGSNIRGHFQTRIQLAQASGYADRSSEFDTLIQILDSETRLITPAEGEYSAGSGEGTPADSYYQLTHDYLVPSLREWLTKKQRETVRGRAELRLEELSQLWNDKPESRRLPGLGEWLGIQSWTRHLAWTDPQRKMMHAATRRFGIRAAVAATLVLCLAWGAHLLNLRMQDGRVAEAVNQLSAIDTSAVPDILSQLAETPSLAQRHLWARVSDERTSTRGKLNVALVLLGLGNSDKRSGALIDTVQEHLAGATADEIPVIRDCLMNHKQPLVARVQPRFQNARTDGDGVLPQASILAAFDPAQRWPSSTSELVATRLVNASVDSIGGWTRNLRPVQRQLLEPLRRILVDKQRSLDERLIAGDVLIAYAPMNDEDTARHMVDVLVESAGAEQFQRIVENLKNVPRAIDVLNAKLTSLDQLARDKRGDERETIGEKQMYVAAAILKLGAPTAIWERFRHSEDPTLRSLLVENLASLGVEASQLVARLDLERDVTVRRALVLALGEYEKAQLANVDLAKVTPDLRQWRQHRDAGLHAAADWTLRRWIEKKIIEAVDGPAQRDEKSGLADRHTSPHPTWYRTPQGHDLMVVDGPVEFQMGSPQSETFREGGAQGNFELQHAATIPRSFAVAAKETTVAQFLTAWNDLKQRMEFRGTEGMLSGWLLFWPVFVDQPMEPTDDFPYSREKARTTDCPINNVDWYHAAAYCNWLSKQDGIPREQWCYEDAPFQNGMTLPPDHLRRVGYRLPTEAEWEYVCRAGATTSRFYGEGMKLLPEFAWCTSNSMWRSWPVGRLKPNDYGLLDIHGNVEEWCQGHARRFAAQPHNDVEQQELRVLSNELRAHRGGGFEYDPRKIRAAARDRSDPDYPYFQLGFRVARTLPD